MNLIIELDKLFSSGYNFIIGQREQRRGELDKNSQNAAYPKKEQLLVNIEVVGEERRRVVEVVGLGQTNQLLSAKKQQLWSHY